MNILFLSRWFPYPPVNGSKLRIYNLLRGLAAAHQVTLLSFIEPNENAEGAAHLRTFCADLHMVTRKPFDSASSRALVGLFSAKPRSVVDTFSQEMSQTIRQVRATGDFDLVVASQFDMAVYSQDFADLPAVLEEVELSLLYERATRAPSLANRLRGHLTWWKHRHYLASLLHNFQACTVVSEGERTLLSSVAPDADKISVIPNGVDLDSYCHIDETLQPNTLIFTGAFSYHPNYEAMTWFLAQVYPLIQEQIPDIRLIITGNHGNRPLPTTEGIILTGFVDDVRPLIARSWSSIVPLHSGGGTRLKILEAMALKTPVVATSKGAEGLDACPGEHLLVADTPDAFAEATIRLLQDVELRINLADKAHQLVAELYDWRVLMPQFLDVVEHAAGHRALALP